MMKINEDRPACNSVFIAGCFWHHAIIVWNSLPNNVVTAPSVICFKDAHLLLTSRNLPQRGLFS